MNYLFFGFILCCIYSCGQKQNTALLNTADSSEKIPSAVSTPSFLITDTSFGNINKRTTYADLQAMFGYNLQDTIDYGAEGMDSFIVTKIYSNTPQELVVNWQLDKFHKAISTVDCLLENSPYQTVDSLKVGSTLEKLVTVNGKKINFYGTGWDYGGLITSYNKGKFDRKNIFFSLNSRQDAQNVMGDQELNTDLPKVKANLKKLYIVKISLSLHNEK